ncbi:DegT/DnrJ/EryC1/StrS family aminotransferase [Nocardia sp. NPDC049707]|uniref:DegT/DnrJ/EryC1/StrS family aminotransferase n=1 Tax=Nocardia sp. NPDC049707 TaxID=3154735 RepID=UPI0034325474
MTRTSPPWSARLSASQRKLPASDSQWSAGKGPGWAVCWAGIRPDTKGGPTLPALHGQVSGHKCITMLASGINRNALREKIFAVGVELARGVYEQPLHRQPVFGGFNIADSFPVADDFAARHLCLPLWRGMTDNMVACVIDTVRRRVAADT